MTETNLPGKTAWESHEYLRDHGHRVAAAQAFIYVGRAIETDPDYPLPPDAEAVIALAAEAMQDYAAGRAADIKAAAAEVHARIHPRSAA